MSPELTTPISSYLVCGTPRSGSSMLCGLLKSSGVAGRAEEYFWRGDEAFWTKRWGVSGPVELAWPDYLRAALSEGTTPNGIFAAKVMWGYLDDLLTALATLPASSGLDAAELLRRTFPDLRFVFIRRVDTVAQAVSLARAHLTQEWYRPAGSEPGPEPDYDYGLIDGLARMVEEHNTAWERWFDDHDIEPFTVRYEDLVVDPTGATRQVLAFLDVDPASAQPIAEQTERQGTALNATWITRYQAERRSRQPTD